MTGSHGRTLVDEMHIGSWGCMPVAAFADLYAATWDLWHQGKHKEAMDIHGRTLLLLTEAGIHSGIEPFKYILYLRGVFKDYAARKVSTSGFTAAIQSRRRRLRSRPSAGRNRQAGAQRDSRLSKALFPGVSYGLADRS